MAAIAAIIPPDATKAPRRIDKTPLNPDGRVMRKFEREGTDRIHTALQYWARSLFRGVTADSVALIMARLDDPEVSKPLRDAMILFLQDVADAGAEHGRKQVERVIMGVKRTPIVEAGAIDWTAANADAAQWAIEYGYQLIRGITDTTRAQVAREIRYFVDNSITINQLRDRLMAGNLFSRNRAEMIAVTETTRAYAEGNAAAWQRSGVVEGKEWMTANDEIVCPICAPLNGKIVKLNESFGMISKPPAHVRCRCYILPVVIGDTEVLSEVGIGPWQQGGAGRNPLASYLQLEGQIAGLARSQYERAVRAIESAHGIPRDLSPIRVRVDGKYSGEYYINELTGRGEAILFDGASDSAMSFIHEFGHHLDNDVLHLNQTRWNPGIRNEATEAYWDAIRKSKHYRDLEYWLYDADDPPSRYVQYMADPKELWARSYAQYVVKKTGGNMLKELESLRKELVAMAWDDNDFTDIERAIETLLSSQGL